MDTTFYNSLTRVVHHEEQGLDRRVLPLEAPFETKGEKPKPTSESPWLMDALTFKMRAIRQRRRQQTERAQGEHSIYMASSIRRSAEVGQLLHCMGFPAMYPSRRDGEARTSDGVPLEPGH